MGTNNESLENFSFNNFQIFFISYVFLELFEFYGNTLNLTFLVTKNFFTRYIQLSCNLKLINIQLTKLKTIRRTVRINIYFYWQNKLGNPLQLFWSCSGDRMVAITSLKPEDYIYLYSISNEFRPFASPYRTLTVTVPYPYRHRTVPHRTPPYFTVPHRTHRF